MYRCLHENYTLFLSYCNKTWIFCAGFQKILIYQILCKSVVREPSCSMRLDRQRYVMKPIAAFPKFMKAPKNTVCCCCCCRCYCHHHHCCCEEILFKFVTHNLKVYSNSHVCSCRLIYCVSHVIYGNTTCPSFIEIFFFLVPVFYLLSFHKIFCKSTMLLLFSA